MASANPSVPAPTLGDTQAKTLGIAAELSAVITEEHFDWLDAPVLRVTYPDTHPPFSPILESATLPNADKIADALRRLVAY